MPQPGIELRTFRTVGDRLIHNSIEEVILKRVLKDNLYTQRSLRDRPRAQGPKAQWLVGHFKRFFKLKLFSLKVEFLSLLDV